MRTLKKKKKNQGSPECRGALTLPETHEFGTFLIPVHTHTLSHIHTLYTGTVDFYICNYHKYSILYPVLSLNQILGSIFEFF